MTTTETATSLREIKVSVSLWDDRMQWQLWRCNRAHGSIAALESTKAPLLLCFAHYFPSFPGGEVGVAEAEAAHVQISTVELRGCI